MNNIPTIHGRVADGLRRTLETVVLGDWSHISEDQLKQAVARLRTIKASYLNHQEHPRHLEQDVLALLDEAIVELYLVLDTVEGRDVEKQRNIYRAILNTQRPLLCALAALPQPMDAEQEPSGAEDASSSQQTEMLAAVAPAAAAPHVNLSTSHQDDREGDEGDRGDEGQQDDKEGYGQDKQFRWSHNRLSQLQEAMCESRQASTLAMAKEIANRFRWPVKAVEYKVYALRQSQRRPQEAQVSAREQVSAATDKEDDRQRQVAEGRDAGHA